MEKAATKAKKKSFLHIIPKAAQAAAVSFQNIPFSPRRDKRADANAAHRHKSHFSGPIMIPPAARGRSKTAEAPEPSSPKVSCIGQIKYKKALSSSCKKKHDPRKIASFKVKKTKAIAVESSQATATKKKATGIMKLFSGGRKSDAAVDQLRSPVAGDSPPRLNQMRKFASSRDTLSNFDWTAAQIAPAEEHEHDDNDDGDFYSDDGEDDVIIPFSAPLIGAGAGAGLELEPRKEINLWKRRTMARPKPLKLN